MKTFLKYFLVLGLTASCSAMTPDQKQKLAKLHLVTQKKPTLLKKVLVAAAATAGLATVGLLMTKTMQSPVACKPCSLPYGAPLPFGPIGFVLGLAGFGATGWTGLPVLGLLGGCIVDGCIISNVYNR